MVRHHISALVVGVFFLLLTGWHVYAEDVSYGVAQLVEMNEPNVENGYIVSTSKNGFYVTKSPYDENLYGVVAEKPAITFIDQLGGANKYQVVTSGTVIVLVNSQNGKITKGDPITASNLRGVGMKATTPGNVIGVALENFDSSDPKKIGKITLKVGVRFFSFDVVNNSVMEIFKISLLKAANEQTPVFFKYFVAGIVILGSILAGFYFFGRVAIKGVEALGRNPLAGRLIQFGIMVNVFITIATIGSGLIIAIIILRL